MMIIEIIITSFLLYMLFRVVNRVIGASKVSKESRVRLTKALSAVELFAWLILLFIFVRTLFLNTPEYPIVVFILLVAIVSVITWYFLRDFFAGIILKAELGLIKGMVIKSPIGQGEIVKAGYRSLEIKSDKGYLTRLPYSQILFLPLSYELSKRDRVEYNFVMNIPFSAGEIGIVREAIKKRILEMPWIPIGEEVKIEITATTQESYSANITIVTATAEWGSKSEEMLRKHFEQHN